VSKGSGGSGTPRGDRRRNARRERLRGLLPRDGAVIGSTWPRSGKSARPAAAPARRAKARVACAASLLRWIYSMAVHDTSWDAAIASGDACQHTPATQRRWPDQRLHPARTRHGCPVTFLPQEGKSEPAKASGTNPAGNPGQLFPGRPELLTRSVERCRGRPTRIRGHAVPACTT
jgi:hypothetical protein